ncbi:hypothetical protein Lfu02_29120 [Longispora fulva]|uniref:Lipoprotein n=1 Tax=Longispora fulva TaxID=619741 RepID=A0A8J7KRZ4_9ACTN|nr:hypothetical protein [Longispora fulva]MBG6139047.1 hypothetical protein [Longispora fulva]GIG58540.1 hypothetical protein Lfu02_29120 [Longispora fulva]
MRVTRVVVAALCCLTAVALTGCDDQKTPRVAQPAVTLTPRAAPSPAATLASPPPAGSVVMESGPFNDRVKITGLVLNGGVKPTVHGHLAVTSDISYLLALDVRAAFYDASGALVCVGHFEYHEEEDQPGGLAAEHDGIDFTVTPPVGAASAATSAVLAIPVLVNE